MKLFFKIVIFFLLCHAGICADGSKQLTKTSTKKFNVEKEIKAFYLSLLNNDPAVKQQFETASKASQDDHGGDFHAFDPNVVSWFPSEDHWNVSKGFDSDDHYLIIQAIGLARGKAEAYDNAIISEVEVIHTGTTKYDDSYEKTDQEPTLISNTITIKFLGFRSFILHPMNPGNTAEQDAAANP